MSEASAPWRAGSVLAGLTVAAAAVVPMVWAISSPPGDVPPSDVAAPLPEVVATVPPTTETIVIEPAPVDVAELPGSIVRALEAAGNLRNEGDTDLGLPRSVLRVLADHAVVLRINEGLAP